ncbi:MAG TPA: DUF3800 domain-containing protein [Rhizomicrobium sp.]|nr:DUF3800 domain-containing protein [Rhizomicrobium sp.]
MLTGYFDDSGTHAGSKVVVWAGFVAPASNWANLDTQWRAILAREKISAFHMSACLAREGGFENWRQADADKVIHDLRQAIKSSNVYGIGSAVSVADWEAVVKPHRYAHLMAPPDDFAFSGCIWHAMELARKNAHGPDLSLVFDDRERVMPVTQSIIDHYKKEAGKIGAAISVTFQKCVRFTGLQAADMLAWESYTYAKKWVETGSRQTARPHFQDFLSWARMRGSFLDREQLNFLMSGAIPMPGAPSGEQSS